jgi:hypothetical protein
MEMMSVPDAPIEWQDLYMSKSSTNAGLRDDRP